ncbi:MAG: response regulator [Clostridia bacterium]
MDNILVVSHKPKVAEYFMDILSNINYQEIIAVTTCSNARTKLIDKEFDLVIINAPLEDENGIAFACTCAQKNIQVILLVKSDYYEEISLHVEDYGVFTIAKPINKSLLWNTIKLCDAASRRMNEYRCQNARLEKQIQDIKIVDKAKCVLIEYLKMTEEQAHHYIEKQAMDMRISKREVSAGILKTYYR